jgi:hypothetical protein
MKKVILIYLSMGFSLFADNHFNTKEESIFSQSGEDGILKEIFLLIGSGNKTFLDIGAGNGKSISNTYNLRVMGWEGIGFDGAYDIPQLNIIKQRISEENILEILQQHQISKEIDFLSLDIDSIDFYILKKILENGFKPRCICAEYNVNFTIDEDKVVIYNPDLVWDGGHYYGASFKALINLATKYGYQPVCTNKLGVNVFFVRQDLMPKLNHVFIGHLHDIYHKGGYGRGPNGGHPLDKKNRTFITSNELLNQ